MSKEILPEWISKMDREEVMRHIEWAQKVAEVARVIVGWSQVDRVRTVGTLLCGLLADADTDDDQAARIQGLVVMIEPGASKGVAKRMADEDLMTRRLRLRLAELTGGLN